MNKQQLVDAVGERLGDRRTAATAVDAVLDTLTTALSDGERVALFGFGVFEKVDRAARTARNPATGGTVDVPATSVPRFRPGQALKDAVNGRTAAARAVPATGAEPPAPATPTKATPKVTKATKGDAKKDKGAKDKAKSKGKKGKGK
jgi:DNA-binding protein HU-beta